MGRESSQFLVKRTEERSCRFIGTESSDCPAYRTEGRMRNRWRYGYRSRDWMSRLGPGFWFYLCSCTKGLAALLPCPLGSHFVHRLARVNSGDPESQRKMFKSGVQGIIWAHFSISFWRLLQLSQFCLLSATLTINRNKTQWLGTFHLVSLS